MESDSHSFIVRMWRERAHGDAEGACWRGSITHVLSGEQLHFFDLSAVQRFIAERIGNKPEESRSGRRGPLGLLGRVNR